MLVLVGKEGWPPDASHQKWLPWQPWWVGHSLGAPPTGGAALPPPLTGSDLRRALTLSEPLPLTCQQSSVRVK